MAITALRSGSVAWPPRRPSHQRAEARGEMMKADALMHFILSGNRSLEHFAVLLARISLGVFFAISGGNKLFLASQYKLMYETIAFAVACSSPGCFRPCVAWP